MTRNNSKSCTIKLRYFFVACVLSLCSSSLLAQNAEGSVENIVIPFDEPFSYALFEETSWNVQNSDGMTLLSGMGNIIKSFSQPGVYSIQINDEHIHNNSCDHSYGPEKLRITVIPEKLKFDFNSIYFSEEIQCGKSISGIVLSINVNYISYDNIPTVYNQGITSFGVGSTISGKLKNGTVTLHPGINTIEFVLDGQSSRGDIVQLNFKDFTGEVQPYSLTPKMQ